MPPQTDPFSEESIRKLHAVFCEKTNWDWEFDFTRLRQWYEWLKWRKSRPFTEDDLRRVIGNIKAGMHKGERREGALRFTNLIGNPDKFEEELSMAMGALKERAPTERKGNYKPVVAPAPEERATPEDFAELLRQNREVRI